MRLSPIKILIVSIVLYTIINFYKNKEVSNIKSVAITCRQENGVCTSDNDCCKPLVCPSSIGFSSLVPRLCTKPVDPRGKNDDFCKIDSDCLPNLKCKSYTGPQYIGGTKKCQPCINPGNRCKFGDLCCGDTICRLNFCVGPSNCIKEGGGCDFDFTPCCEGLYCTEIGSQGSVSYDGRCWPR